jgi:hypothetical protein
VGVAFALPAIATGAPWLLLRLAETGNPVFPFFNDIFHSSKWPPVNERFDLYLYGIGHGWRRVVEVWWEATVRPGRFGQALPAWSLGLPLLSCLAAIPAALSGVWSLAPSSSSSLTRRGTNGLEGTRRIFTALAFLAFGAWFIGSQYHRYALPAVTLLALPAAAALWAALKIVASKHAALLSALFLGSWFVLSIGVALATFRPDPYPTRFLLGEETRPAYRERVIPDYLPISFLNGENVTASDQGLIYGYPYNYFSAIPLFDTNLPATLSPGRRIAESGLAPAELARALVGERVRWLVVDRSLPIEDQQYSRWLFDTLLAPDFLARYTGQVYERYNVVVYRIADKP